MSRYIWTLPSYSRRESSCFTFCGLKFWFAATTEDGIKGDVLCVYIEIPECANLDQSMSIGISSRMTIVSHTDPKRSISHYSEYRNADIGLWHRNIWNTLLGLKGRVAYSDQIMSDNVRFMNPDFYTCLNWSYGGCMVRLEKIAPKGLISPDGEFMIDVQLQPVTTLKWEIENFLGVQDTQKSTPFTLGGSIWEVWLYPEGVGQGALSHLSVFLRKFDDDDWRGFGKQVKFGFSLIDAKGQRKYDKASTYAFSATKNGWGFPLWIPLKLLSKSSLLPKGSLQLVVELRAESIIWPLEVFIDSGTISERRESPEFCLGGTSWSAAAGSIGCLENAIAVSSCDKRSKNDDFVIKPEFAISVTGSNAAVDTTVWPNMRVVENGAVYWTANMTEDTGDQFETKFTLAHAPRAVSWLVKGARSFILDSVRPPKLKSGKIRVNNWDVELTLYLQGHGEGSRTHISCFLAIMSPYGDSDVSLMLNVEFAIFRGDEKMLAVGLEEVIVSSHPVGVDRFLLLRDADEVLNQDGSLRIDVHWSHEELELNGERLASQVGRFTSTCGPFTFGMRRSFPPCKDAPLKFGAPIDVILPLAKPSREHSDVGTLDYMLEGERKLQELRKLRSYQRVLGELHDADDIVRSKVADVDSWDDHGNAATAIDFVANVWMQYMSAQNKVRRQVSLQADFSEATMRRDNARAAFCTAVDNVPVSLINGLYETHLRCIPTLEDLEHRFSYEDLDISWTMVVADARAALCVWDEWKTTWEKRFVEACDASDRAAHKMQETFQGFFSAQASGTFDQAKITADYYDLLVQMRKEESMPPEVVAHFPVIQVVKAYYALHERASIVKKNVGELLEIWERQTARYEEVSKWVGGSPKMEVLDEHDHVRAKLLAAKYRIQASWYDADLLDEEDRLTQRKQYGDKIAKIIGAARENELANLADRARLWKIQQNHFPEIVIPCTTNDGIVSLLSEHRSLDMYSDHTCLHSGQHCIWKAKFGGEWCVLKHFLSATEMLREAKIQYKLCHPTIVPILAVFHVHDAGGSYMHLPLYKTDLATWLQHNTLSVKECGKMVSTMLTTIEHLHQANIIHGDLKPRNFLLDKENALVLCDFGSVHTTSETLTLPTLSCTGGGTPGYIAPELAKEGSTPSKASDMYSLGCIIKNDMIPRVHSGAEGLHELAIRLCAPNPDHRPMALTALTGMLHYPVSGFPSYWRTKTGVISHIRENTRYMERYALEFLRESTTHTGDGGCSMKRLKEAVVIRVDRNENPVLYRSYLRRKAEISEYHEKRGNSIARAELSLVKKEWMIDPSVNECYMMHGTLAEHVPTILEDGVNERIARYGGLYGVGSYFTTQSCKAMQYCQRPLLRSDTVQRGKEYCMLVCRVLLGDAHNTTKIFLPENGNFEACLREPPAKNQGRWDSIVVLPGWKSSCDGKQPYRHEQIHNEAIIFDRTQIYPEFVIRFKIP